VVKLIDSAVRAADARRV